MKKQIMMSLVLPLFASLAFAGGGGSVGNGGEQVGQSPDKFDGMIVQSLQYATADNQGFPPKGTPYVVKCHDSTFLGIDWGALWARGGVLAFEPGHTGSDPDCEYIWLVKTSDGYERGQLVDGTVAPAMGHPVDDGYCWYDPELDITSLAPNCAETGSLPPQVAAEAANKAGTQESAHGVAPSYCPVGEVCDTPHVDSGDAPATARAN